MIKSNAIAWIIFHLYFEIWGLRARWVMKKTHLLVFLDWNVNFWRLCSAVTLTYSAVTEDIYLWLTKTASNPKTSLNFKPRPDLGQRLTKLRDVKRKYEVALSLFLPVFVYIVTSLWHEKNNGSAVISSCLQCAHGYTHNIKGFLWGKPFSQWFHEASYGCLFVDIWDNDVPDNSFVTLNLKWCASRWCFQIWPWIRAWSFASNCGNHIQRVRVGIYIN